jgi:hypothetical protein
VVAFDGDSRARIGARIEIGEKLSGGQAGGRNAEIGSYFGERDEYEGTLAKAGMRDFKTGLGEDKIAIEEDIEVDGARTVGHGARAIAAKEALDEEKVIKQCARREIGFKGDDGVEEAGLIGGADRLGGIERGTRGDATQRANVLNCSGKRGIGRPGGAGKVGAEGDVGEGHADLRVAEVVQSAPESAPLNLVASVFGETLMDTLNGAGLGARRNEDIALDLLKFVAATAGVGKTALPSTGFTGAGGAKPEEHVNQLLALYSRCLKAVEGKTPEKEAAK